MTDAYVPDLHEQRMERKCPVQRLREAVRRRMRDQARKKEAIIEEQSVELRNILSERKEKEVRRRAAIEAGKLRREKVKEHSAKLTKKKFRMKSSRCSGGKKTGGGDGMEGDGPDSYQLRDKSSKVGNTNQSCSLTVYLPQLGLAPEQQGGVLAEGSAKVERTESSRCSGGEETGGGELMEGDSPDSYQSLDESSKVGNTKHTQPITLNFLQKGLKIKQKEEKGEIVSKKKRKKLKQDKQVKGKVMMSMRKEMLDTNKNQMYEEPRSSTREGSEELGRKQEEQVVKEAKGADALTTVQTAAPWVESAVMSHLPQLEQSEGRAAEGSTNEHNHTLQSELQALAPAQHQGGDAVVSAKEQVASAGDSDRAKQSPSLHHGHQTLAPEQDQGGEAEDRQLQVRHKQTYYTLGTNSK